jgi:hypothetical protein
MRKVALIAAMLMAFGFGGAAAFAATADKPPSPPGQPDCEHGNSGAECKEDPQPEHGGDCQEHGKKGGQNEDHCLDETTSTETTPEDTTPQETTPQETTPQETTPQDTTPQETTPADTPATVTTPGEPTEMPPSGSSSPSEGDDESTAPEASPEQPDAGTPVVLPAAAQTQRADESETVAGASATPQPTTAPQSAPFTP